MATGEGRYWLESAVAAHAGADGGGGNNGNGAGAGTGNHASASAIHLPSSSGSMERGSSASSSSTSSGSGSGGGKRGLQQQHRLSPTSSPSLSSSASGERGNVTLPSPRRIGSSLPVPSYANTLQRNSATHPNHPSSSSSSSSLSSINALQRRSRYSTRIQSIKQTIQYSYEGLHELFKIIHPSSSSSSKDGKKGGRRRGEWSSSAYLTDQASWSLICYKLYVLSITIPVNSKLYFYYLPSCLLSDLFAVLILQLGWWFAFERRRRNRNRLEEEEEEDLVASGPSYGYESIVKNGTGSGGTDGDSASRMNKSNSTVLQSIISVMKRPSSLFHSYGYTALPFDTTHYNNLNPETPPLLSSSNTSRRTNNGSDLRGEGTVTGLGIVGKEGGDEEEGRSLLSSHWEDDTPLRRERISAGHPTAHVAGNISSSTTRLSQTEGGHVAGMGYTYNQEGQTKDENGEIHHHEDITLIDEVADRKEEGGEGKYHDNDDGGDDDPAYGGDNSHHKATTRSCGDKSSRVFWFIFQMIHIIACFVAIVFTVIAVGAYSAGRVVFSWQGAFDSSGQSGYLFGYALTEFPHFLATYATIFGLGTVTTFARCWIPRWIENGTAASKFHKYAPIGKLRYAIVSLAVVSFLAVCAAVRPPKAITATDLLIDGISATSAILFFKDEHTHPIAMNKNTTIYGQSNAFQPRLTTLDTDAIKHVFFIFLESADYLAWPYQPDKFCKHRNCEDIPEEYNKVEEFTPFFNDLIKNDKNTLFVNDFRTNLAYTIKAHLASMCGIMPHIHDYISSEAEMDSPTACLPHIVKALSDNAGADGNGGTGKKGDGAGRKWRSGWFQAQMTAYDKQHQVIEREGFEEIWDSNTLTAKFGKKKEWTNYFGYADEELYPFVWDWIDDRLKNDESIFMATAGATMHHPFTVPPWVEQVEYTKTDWTNKYLNVVKRTDNDLKIFFDNLKSRNLLDKSLIIIQGDHGPRIGEDGIYVDYGWWEHIYRAPLAIRAPGLIPHQIEQDPIRPFIALDILPTILDALGVRPSIMKSFVGQSIFRARSQRHLRDSYHAQSRGGQYPHHLRTMQHHTYKAMVMEKGDICATDVKVDPSETFFYCVEEGWRKTFEGEELKDGLSKGLWIEGSKEEKALIEYAHEAKKLLENHLEVNKDFWDVGKHKEENKLKKENFLNTVREQAHWH